MALDLDLLHKVRVLFFMRHWWQRWKVTIRKVQYVTTPKGGYIIAPDANADWADEQLAKYPNNYRDFRQHWKTASYLSISKSTFGQLFNGTARFP